MTKFAPEPTWSNLIQIDQIWKNMTKMYKWYPNNNNIVTFRISSRTCDRKQKQNCIILIFINLSYLFRPCKKLDKSSVKFEKPTFGSEVICKTAFRSLLAVKKKVTSQQETRAAIIKFKAFKMVWYYLNDLNHIVVKI